MQTRPERLRAFFGGRIGRAVPDEQRPRDYLRRDEVASLLRTAKKSRHGARDYAMILLAYRHGLRASELVNLRVSDVDLHAGTIYCRRAKGGRCSVHPLKTDEIDALKRVLARRKWPQSDSMFQSDRVETITRSAFWRIVSEAGKHSGLPFNAYVHQLRHGCGYYLSNKGCELRLIQDYLGHVNINNTVRYTRLNPARFEGLW